MLPLTAGSCIIHLDHLHLRHQLALTASTRAASREARAASRGRMLGYVERIMRSRAAVGDILSMERIL